MASTNINAVFTGKLSAEELSPVYLLHGDEGYLVSRVTARLIEIALAGAPKDFNLDYFRAGEIDPARIRDMAYTLPMMAARRVIHLGGVDKLREDGLQYLVDYIKEPVDTCLLLLTADVRLPLKKKVPGALSRAAKKTGTVAEFRRLKESELPGWVDRMAGERNLKIDTDARSFLIRAVGSDLGRLADELEKAGLYIGDRDRIRLEDLQELVADVRLDALYMLTSHLAAGKLDQAMALVDRMLERGSHPLQIMPLLVRHIRQLLEGVQADSRGENLRETAEGLGIYQGFLIERFIK